MPTNEFRDQQIVDLYMDGTIIQEIADDLNISYPTAHGTLKRLGMIKHPDRKPERRKPRAYSLQTELSKAHRILGVRIYTARAKLSYDLPNLSRMTGISVKKLSGIEAGISDISFLELLHLGHVLGFDLTELVKGMECISNN